MSHACILLYYKNKIISTSIGHLFHTPFVWGEAGNQEDDNRDTYICEDNVHPNFAAQRRHEREDREFWAGNGVSYLQ